jgi:hypothetical protein
MRHSGWRAPKVLSLVIKFFLEFLTVSKLKVHLFKRILQRRIKTSCFLLVKLMGENKAHIYITETFYRWTRINHSSHLLIDSAVTVGLPTQEEHRLGPKGRGQARYSAGLTYPVCSPTFPRVCVCVCVCVSVYICAHRVLNPGSPSC